MGRLYYTCGAMSICGKPGALCDASGLIGGLYQIIPINMAMCETILRAGFMLIT
jgi:hypothetical protein